MSIIQAEDVFKTYAGGVHALHGVTLTVDDGEWVSLTGPSGSGKSTLLNVLGCLDSVSSGRIVMCGEEVSALDSSERTRFRREKVGLVFQQFHLIPYLTAVENVMVAQYYHSLADETEAAAALEKVGLAHRLNHLPSQLSGGEQQRVCLARALINQPKIILADEPTGNLDEENERTVLEIFQNLQRLGHTLLVATHDNEVARLGNRRVQLVHGRLLSADFSEAEHVDHMDDVLEHFWVYLEAGVDPVPFSSVLTLANRDTLRDMERHGWIQVDTTAVKLIGDGLVRASDLIRRHRLAERLFLAGTGRADVVMEREACRFEHLLTSEMTENICRFLGHPSTCPHGKPIPRGVCCRTGGH